MHQVKTVLKQNDFGIQNELAKLEKVKHYFNAVLQELQKTNFDFTLTEFQSLCYSTGANLKQWLKEKTIEATPSINTMPITKEAKLSLIAVDDFTMLFIAFDKLPVNRRAVYSFDFSDTSELKISDLAIQKIQDDFTIYGNDKETEVFNELSNIKSSLDSFRSKFGFSPLSAGSILIRVNHQHEVTINVEGIHHVLSVYSHN